jgi:hypothetical protein
VILARSSPESPGRKPGGDAIHSVDFRIAFPRSPKIRAAARHPPASAGGFWILVTPDARSTNGAKHEDLL